MDPLPLPQTLSFTTFLFPPPLSALESPLPLPRASCGPSPSLYLSSSLLVQILLPCLHSCTPSCHLPRRRSPGIPSNPQPVYSVSSLILFGVPSWSHSSPPPRPRISFPLAPPPISSLNPISSTRTQPSVPRLRHIGLSSSIQEHDSDDDSYEVLDLTEYARRHHWWNRVFGHSSGPIVEKYSVATQIVMGGVTGWCAGFLFQKVGKLAATAVGGGFLLLQIASHSGYVQVDWKRVEKDVNKAKRQIKKRANKAAPEINTIIEESTEFIKQNIVVSSGFVGGFLLGLAS
ncbi:FUN14 domain-containing protein 1 isoform X1 [Vombatus ursinus]|uniref:FUN14 domain-containing protein 1 isoform X1 n=1 Tax=Vombatus ursinus TaxID=29139 RepID=UPI000FFDB70F|nr:FUN14 domain-containing protein 1 isoform X1 [Vombatus ursinus]